ncbi:MAG: AI-2E family transporter [Treponemataceae bacterium]
MESKHVQTWFFAGLLFLLFIGVARIFAPFFSVLLWSSLLYVLFSPFYHRIVKKLNLETNRGRILRNLFAAFFSVASVIIIVVPLVFLTIQLGKQLSSLIKFSIKYLNANPQLPFIQGESVTQLFRDLSFGAIDLSTIDVKQRIISALTGGANAMIQMTTHLARNIGVFILNLLFMVFSLFFFYVDGEYLLKLARSAVPIRSEYAGQLIQKFRDITRNLFLGYFMVAGYQAVAAYIIFIIFGVHGALAFAILVFFCSFIPMFGAAGIWLPLGIARVLSGDLIGGIVFMALCGFFVSTMDNFLRPMFLKDRINLHPLVIFFAIMGGLAVFGFNGLVLGPMLIIFFLTVLDLFLIEHGFHRVIENNCD